MTSLNQPGTIGDPPSWFARLRALSLPEAVHREFVDMLFGMRVPVVGMGAVFVTVAMLLSHEWHDNLLQAMALTGLVVTAARYGLMTAYQRARIENLADLRRWEHAYGVGNYLFATLLGLLNVRLSVYNEPLAQLLGVAMVFSFCAGIVARISVRRLICAISVLLATVPLVLALAWQAWAHSGDEFHAELLAIASALIAMITALSLQTMVHLHRSAVRHHVSRHDLGRMAKHDALTGLANRLRLREDFRGRSQRSFREGSQLALLFIDLDGFKGVNDNFGHPAGDVVLQQVASRLGAMVRENDVVARLGGDEFVVVQSQVAADSEAEMLGRRIIKRLSEPYAYEDHELRISASVGIAMLPTCGVELETLLAAADAALYRSKLAGKNTVTFAAAGDGAPVAANAPHIDADEAMIGERAV